MAKQHKTFKKRAPVKASAFGNGGFKDGYDEGGEVSGTDAISSYQRGGAIAAPLGGNGAGEIQPRPIHAIHNDTHRRMIANAHRRDPYHAVRLLQGLRREHQGLRTLGAMALAHSHGLRAVGRHELAHGHDAHALHLLNHAHAKVPDGAEVNFTQHGDHHFNANVKRNGRETNYPLNRHQLLQWAIGPAGGFDHSLDNGVEKNLGILTRPRGMGPVRGYQEGGEVARDPYGYSDQGGMFDPTAAADDDAQRVRDTIEYARELHKDRLGDYITGTGDHSSPPEEVDQHRTLAATEAPTTAGRERYDPLAPVKEFLAPSKSPLQWGGAAQMPPKTFEQPQPGREGTQTDRDLFETPQAFEQPQPEREGIRGFAAMPAGGYGEIPTADVTKPGGRFEEYGETKLTPRERQNAAYQQRLEEQQPRIEAKRARIDAETERQIRAGLIQPGEPLRNPYHEQIVDRFPLGPSDTRGIFAGQTPSQGQRTYTDLDRKREQWNRDHVWGVEEAPRMTGRGAGTFVAPLSRDPQGRDVVRSDIYGRSPSQQVREGLRPPTADVSGAPERWMPGAIGQEPPAPSWTPPPNIRGAVGQPPPPGDMSPEAVAARAYPSAAQQPARAGYVEKLRASEAATREAEEERASKERVAGAKEEGLSRRAEMTATERRARTDMLRDAYSDRTFANMQRTTASIFNDAQKQILTSVRAKLHDDKDYQLKPEEQRVWDEAVKRAQQAPEQRTRAQETGKAETEPQQEQPDEPRFNVPTGSQINRGRKRIRLPDGTEVDFFGKPIK